MVRFAKDVLNCGKIEGVTLAKNKTMCTFFSKYSMAVIETRYEDVVDDAGKMEHLECSVFLGNIDEILLKFTSGAGICCD